MKGLHILMIDDSEHDTILIGEALNGSGIVQSLGAVINGEEALKYLRKEPPYLDKTLPDLILLDINMPVMDGHETLVQIKSDDRLKHIPVIMLTTSSAYNDIKKAYQQYSNSYIVKPYEILDLNSIVETIKNYWLNTVRLTH